MKKFVVLMLVLGMASLASAVLVENLTWTDGNVTWALDVGNSRVTATTSSAGDYFLDFIQQSTAYGRMDPTPVGNLPSGTASTDGLGDGTYRAAGDLGQVWDPYAAPSDGLYWTVESADGGEALPDQAAGLLFQFDVTFDGNGDFIMSQYSGGDFQTRLSTPEPMTMVLLGLGGLFLRRRKTA